jgi:hypothetical protein
LAIGTRLSFAPAIAPFLGAIYLHPNRVSRETKLSLLLSFSFGMLVSMLPVLLTFTIAPKQFVFGNIGYAVYNTVYREQMGFQTAMTIGNKFVYLAKMVIIQPGNLFLFSAFLAFVSTNFINGREKIDGRFEIIFLISLVFFLLIGSFAPTPSWYQYFYAPVPFLVLGIVYAVASCDLGKGKRIMGLFALVVIVSGVYGVSNYRHVDNLLRPNEWIPNKVHKAGMEIAAAAGKNRVLTLAPIFPLEGNAEVYKEFSTGSYAWRIAPLLPRNERKELGIVSKEDLSDFLKTKPPKAILVGDEGSLESPLLSYAREKGYKALELSNGMTLWLSS